MRYILKNLLILSSKSSIGIHSPIDFDMTLVVKSCVEVLCWFPPFFSNSSLSFFGQYVILLEAFRRISEYCGWQPCYIRLHGVKDLCFFLFFVLDGEPCSLSILKVSFFFFFFWVSNFLEGNFDLTQKKVILRSPKTKKRYFGYSKLCLEHVGSQLFSLH